MVVALVFLHDLSHEPASWRRVSDYISPTWAVAAPDLRECASLGDMRTVIARDLDAVTYNPRPGAVRPPVLIVAAGPAVIPALDFAANDEQGVAGIVAVSPQTSVGAFAGLARRMQGKDASATMRGALRHADIHIVDEMRETALARGTRLWVLEAEKGRKPDSLVGAQIDVVREAARDWIHYAPDALASRDRKSVV